MKIVYIILIIVCPLSLFTQIHFKENIIYEKQIDFVVDVLAVDINLDGSLDLLVASNADSNISWFENSGIGSFDIQHIITDNAPHVLAVYAKDINGDSIPDVLAAISDEDKIAWYENDGLGNFGPQQIITTLADEASDVFSIDIDNDGDNDVISASRFDNKIAWYENDGLGNFGPQIILSTAVYWPTSVFSIDLDGDSLNDVLSASLLDHKVAWYKNLGSGLFGPQHILTSQAFNANTVIAIDLDGDNDNDVLSASSLDNKVSWYENMGAGIFGGRQNISTQFNNPHDLFSEDIDSDGDNDVVFATWGPTHGTCLAINDGYGGFALPVVIDSTLRSYTVNCGDFNGDEDIDIVAASDGNLVWYPNDSTGNFEQRHTITFEIDSPYKINYCDLDGDSAVDIIVGSNEIGGKIYWFKNLGAGSYILKDTLSREQVTNHDITSVDFDGDSTIDIVSLTTGNNYNNIVLFKNDGLGCFAPPQIISDSATSPKSIFAADMDNDGDQDILFGSVDSPSLTNDSKISMWKNDGLGNFGNEIVISQSPNGCMDVIAADLDNDNDLDILAAKGQVIWYENLGAANSFDFHFISAGIGAAMQVAAADLDGDNDLDVICSADDATGNGDIRWWRNNGNGAFTAMPYLTNWLNTPRIISVNDLDKDGDIDIIGQQDLDATSLFWFANDGLGNFGTLQTIADSLDITTIVTCDLDEDGDIDILFNAQFVDKILWAENLGYLTSDTDSTCANQPYTFGTLTITSPGIYHDTLQTIFGLDSVIELEFSHIPVPSVEISPFPQDTFCIEDEFIDFPPAYPLGGYYTGPGVSGTNINLYLADTGLHEISYHYIDTITGCSNSDTTQLLVISCLTISEAEEMGIMVYPNPTQDYIMVNCQNMNLSGSLKIRLFNSTGSLVQEETPAGFPHRINISHLKPGLYYLQLYNGEKTVVYKVVKR